MQEILGTKRERFKKNLLTLADKDPSLLARVEQSVGEERLIRAENGELTIKDGSLYLESRVSPKKQATRFARLVAGKSEVFLFFGCGLGYHINELVGPQKRGILVEEDIEVFKAALFVLEPAVTERLLLLIGLPAKEAVSKIPYHELEDCSVVAHPISGRVRPRYYEAVENGVRRMLQRELASRVTTVSSQRLWTRNVFRNIGLWKEGYRLLHKGCAKKFFGPVLLVASGPWLEEAMEKIAGLSKKIPVFSLLPSLPYLLSCGVKPDIVLSTDAGFYNRDRARAALDAAGRTRLSLFTTFSADPGMLRVWRGNVLFFSHGLAAETLFGDITGDTLSIPMQGTSALVMILLARALGFDRILLAGYDFAVKGIKDHHRGGGFDTLDLAGSSRFFRWDTAVVSRLAGDGFFGIGAGTNGEKFLKGGDGNAASGIVSGVYGDSIDEKETRG
ncbi:MAG: motility associated factor glycosyltransferase family protein, partial [Spirochaetes bacterium]|nr:motility associated factor glycosyltransferase family protein [Spirochaetota bacterium]